MGIWVIYANICRELGIWARCHMFWIVYVVIRSSCNFPCFHSLMFLFPFFFCETHLTFSNFFSSSTHHNIWLDCYRSLWMEVVIWLYGRLQAFILRILLQRTGLLMIQVWVSSVPLICLRFDNLNAYIYFVYFCRWVPKSFRKRQGHGPWKYTWFYCSSAPFVKVNA